MERDDESVNKSTRHNKVRAPERGVLIRTRLESVCRDEIRAPLPESHAPCRSDDMICHDGWE